MCASPVPSQGCIGILSTVKIQVEPRFHLKQIHYPMKLKNLLPRVQDVMGQGEHSRFWWFPHTEKVYVTHMERTKEEPQHPSILDDLKALNTKLLGVHLLEALYFLGRSLPQAIPWVNRMYQCLMYGTPAVGVDRSFEGFNFDCRFKQYVTEWSIPRENCDQAMRQLQTLIDDPKNRLFVHFPVEIRFVKKDDIWLSGAYGRDSCYIGIIMYRPYGFDVEYKKYFQDFEQIMFGLEGRPHWAKTFTLKPEDFKKMYPKWEDFRAVRQKLDPNKLFWNDYLDRLFADEKQQ